MAKKELGPKGAIAIVAAIVVFAASVFLFDKGDGFTGFEILKMQSWEFWLWIGIATVITVVCFYFAAKVLKNDTNNSEWIALILLFIGFAVQFGAWGKAATDKANNGVTAPHYKSK